MKVGLVGQKDNPRARSLVEAIGRSLRQLGVSVAVDEVTAGALEADRRPGYGSASDRFEPETVAVDDLHGCDLVVSIGGDGTFLFAARGVDDTPIMGVNLGEVGFLNAVSPADAVATVLDSVERVRAGDLRTRELPRLVASNDEWALAPGLNEVLVQGPRRGHGGGATFEVRVDGSVYTRGHADGVLVATPTGSTAYNLSEGGPLVHPSVPGLVVTEMAGSDGKRPLVVDVDSVVTIAVSDASEAIAVSDGRARETVNPPTEIRVRAAKEPARVAGPAREFFAALGKLE